VSPVERPAPNARGDLEKRPLAHLLVYALERRLTGSMELTGPRGEEVIVFRDGIPQKARTSAAAPGLREQLDELFDAPDETAFAYYDGLDALPHVGVTALDPLSIVWRGLRRKPPWPHVRAVLERVGAQAVRLAASPELGRLQLNSDETRAAELFASAPRRLRDIVDAKVIPEGRAGLLLYCLLITRRAEIVLGAADAPPPRPATSRPPSSPRGDREPPSSGRTLARLPLKPMAVPSAMATEERAQTSARDRRASVPPPGATSTPRPASSPAPSGASAALAFSTPIAAPRQAILRQEIVARAESIGSEDFFQALGVARTSGTAEIRGAFLHLAKTWHPDRLAPELGDLRDVCGRVFAHMSDAHATLSDPERRERYVKALAEGGSSAEEQKKVGEVVEALGAFQRAEVFYKRGDRARAESECRRAVRLDPEQADYLALLAWIEATGLDSTADQVTSSIAALGRAIELHAKCEKAYFYRGMLHKKQGAIGLAHRDFRAVAEMNPRNVDAQREVRLYQMRQAKKGGEPPRDGVQRDAVRDNLKDTGSGESRMPPPRESKAPSPPMKPGFLQKLFKK